VKTYFAKSEEDNLPDSSEADIWLDADTFVVGEKAYQLDTNIYVYAGKAYRIAPDCSVSQVEGESYAK